MHEGLFHLSVKMVQRSKGRSATGAIAYRAAIDITDERTGLRFDYKRKAGVSCSAILLPSGADPKYQDRSVLWNAVEQKENRMNSAVAREFECALPYDLPRDDRERIGIDFAQYIVDRFGVAADINFHDPHPRDKVSDMSDSAQSRNYHFHLLTSTRVLTSEGFTDKVRDLDSAKTGSAIVDEIRRYFSQLVNAAYASNGKAKFVDHRSFERRGIDRHPQIHVGVNQEGERATVNAAIIAANEHIVAMERTAATIQQQIKDLLAEQTTAGKTIAPFVLERVNPDLPLSPEDIPAEWQPAPRQFEIDLLPSQLRRATASEESGQIQESSMAVDKLRRYKELEQLRESACIYGRATMALQDQRSDAAAFQRELVRLDKPNIMHRLLNTKSWQAYEYSRDCLSTRIKAAEFKAERLQTVVKNYLPFQRQWDRFGWAEHRVLARELGCDTAQIDPTRQLRPELSLATEINYRFESHWDVPN